MSRIPDAINNDVEIEFTQIRNSVLRDPKISLKAKGLLTLLLSNKDGWISYQSALKKCTKEGDDAIRSGVKELQENGYLIKCRYKDKETKQIKGSFWAYTSVPNCFNIEKTINMLEEKGYELQSKSHSMGNPHHGSPHEGKHHTNNTNSKKTNNKNTNISSSDMEETNKNKSTISNGFITPSQFDKFWSIYPKRLSGKGSKGAAKKRWDSICTRKDNRPTWKEIRKALQTQKQSEQWQKNKGKFIPLPTTWLNQARWMDDMEELNKDFGNDPKTKVGGAEVIPDKYADLPFTEV